ncbi:MAG: cyclic nucleotide-binding domain-containing protein [Deltaproteobacteria bacterium]|nr:cyclic nucleotide-binding domain-containing protein [Deltaproteobacteria bacterium]
MMSTVEKALILKEIELFSRIPGDDLARLAFLAEEVIFEPGEIVFEEGELGDALYLVLSGRAKIYRGKTVLAEVKEKDVYGEMALLDSEPRSASVSAIDELKCLRIARADFNDLLSERNSVARGIIQVLVKRLRVTSDELEEARQYTAPHSTG